MNRIEQRKPRSIVLPNDSLQRLNGYYPHFGQPFSNSLCRLNESGNTASVLGQAAHFAAASQQFYYLPDSPDFDVTGNLRSYSDFWCAGWVKWTSNYAIIFGKEGKDSGRDYDMFIDPSGFAYFSMWDDNEVRHDATSAGMVTSNTWAFVLGWYDSAGQVINVQINDGIAVSGDLTGTPNVSGQQFNIGGLAEDGLYCTSTIDTVVFGNNLPTRIDRVISDISTTLYNSGTGLAAKYLTSDQITNWGVVSGWDFDGDATDAIGSNDLRQVRSPTFTTGIVPA